MEEDYYEDVSFEIFDLNGFPVNDSNDNLLFETPRRLKSGIIRKSQDSGFNSESSEEESESEISFIRIKTPLKNKYSEEDKKEVINYAR